MEEEYINFHGTDKAGWWQLLNRQVLVSTINQQDQEQQEDGTLLFTLLPASNDGAKMNDQDSTKKILLNRLRAPFKRISDLRPLAVVQSDQMDDDESSTAVEYIQWYREHKCIYGVIRTVRYATNTPAFVAGTATGAQGHHRRQHQHQHQYR